MLVTPGSERVKRVQKVISVESSDRCISIHFVFFYSWSSVSGHCNIVIDISIKQNCLLPLGNSKKYPYLYHGRLLGFPKGKGGFFELEFRRNGGVFTIWKSKGMGGFHREDFWGRKSRVRITISGVYFYSQIQT